MYDAKLIGLVINEACGTSREDDFDLSTSKPVIIVGEM